jgi:predicted transcriptional regulator
MEANSRTGELLEFFKALSDANRLKIIGLLASKPYVAEELAALLDLRPSTVSNHLAALVHAGLVCARRDGYYNVYELDQEALHGMARRLLSEETYTTAIADIDLAAYDRKVLEAHARPDGTLHSLPAQRKKLEAVLRYLAREFEPGVEYSEAEVNAIIGRYHEDISGLRRDLIDFRMLGRDKRGSRYWRIGEGGEQR